MSETTNQNLSGVSETYLAPLYWKAMESQRPDAMIKDEKAVALVTQREPRLFPRQADPYERIAQCNADHVHPRNGPLCAGIS